VNNLDPNRGLQGTFNSTVGAPEPLVSIPYDHTAAVEDLRTTLKTMQEQPVPLSNIQPDQVEGYIYNPPVDVKATQKLECDPFPFARLSSNPFTQDGSVYQMAQDTDLRASLKLQAAVPIHNVDTGNLPHTEFDLTAPSEKTETKRQYYEQNTITGNIVGDQFSMGTQGPQAYAEWTKVAKRGGSDAQQFRVVPNRVTDSLSNQGNFSPGCSQRDVYPEMLREAPMRLQMSDNTAQQTDFTATMQRPLPAQTTCFKKGDQLERDTSMYTMQPMALSMVGQM
jgi:hypothetical protein